DDRMTPAEDFRHCYRALIDKLSAPYENGPKKGKRPDVVVANIPDINDLPILVPLGCKIGQTCKLPFKINHESLPGYPFTPKDGSKLLTEDRLQAIELCLTKADGKKTHPAGSKVSLIACIDNDLNGRHALFTALREGKRCFTDAQVLHPDQLARISKRIDD